VRAASFKSLYLERPQEDRAATHRCVAGRSRYSTKTYEDHPEFVSPSVILYEKWTMHRHRGIRGTRYLFPPLRRITLHAPDTSQRVERFQHDSSGWINLDSTQQLNLL